MGDNRSDMLSGLFYAFALIFLVVMAIGCGVGFAAGIPISGLVCTVCFFCGFASTVFGITGLIKSNKIHFRKHQVLGYVVNKQLSVYSIIGPSGNNTQVHFVLNVMVDNHAYPVTVTAEEFTVVNIDTIVSCTPTRKWYGAIKDISNIHYAIAEKKEESSDMEELMKLDLGAFMSVT